MGRVASLSKEDGVIRPAYVLSVLDLRHVCEKLTSNEENRGNTSGYQVLRPNDGCVLIRFSDDPTDFGGLNSLCFGFSTVAQFSDLENRGNTSGYQVLRPNDGCVLIRFSDDPTDFGGLNSLCFGFSTVAQFSGLARLHRHDEAGQI